MTNPHRLMAIIHSTSIYFHNSTSPWGEFSPPKTRLISMSSIGYPMVDLTIKLESPQVYSNDHLPDPSMEVRDVFQCTRKSSNLLVIGSSLVSLQQLLISQKTLSQVSPITMSDLHSCSSWKQKRWNNIVTCVQIHQVSTSAIYLCTMCVAGRPGASDYPLPDKSDLAIKKIMSQLSIWGSI